MAKIRADQFLRPTRSFTPPSGSLLYPINWYNSSTGSPGTGTLFLEPFEVGPQPLTIQSVGVAVVAAYVAGSSTGTYTIGLWPDDGSGGMPAWSSLLAQAPLTPTATGNSYATFSQTLTPGLWWVGFLYVQGATAPTTAATFACIANVTPQTWVPATSTIGTPGRALRALGQTSIPSSAPTVSVTGSADAPLMAIRRA